MAMKFNRREALKLMGYAGTTAVVAPSLYAFKTPNTIMKRAIPSSGATIPVVGLGTWQTFDVGSDTTMHTQLLEVLNTMQSLGGTMIDSSPMYGTSEQVVGTLTQQTAHANHFFYATKVWTHGKASGIAQMEASFKKMQRNAMDLMQIHNLMDWQTHIKTLRDWKAAGKIKYFGFTHYTNDSHDTLAKLIKQEQPDFVEFNYAINDRNAEKRLLNVAQDQGTAVIINRPYNGGSLFRKVRGHAVPAWCADMDIQSWGQYFLKYIISHPAVTCVIPGTSKAKHVKDNMGAGYGRLPSMKERAQLLSFLQSL